MTSCGMTYVTWAYMYWTVSSRETAGLRDGLLGVFVFFFFFQAEDGIRDLTVTGVQTCALPISVPERLRRLLGRGGVRRPRVHPRGARRAGPVRLRGPEAPPHPGGDHPPQQIGRASCRERV